MPRSMFAPVVQTSGWTRPPSKFGYGEFTEALDGVVIRGRGVERIVART
jgi:hypothetical protein